MAAGLQQAVADLRYRLSDGRRTLLGIAGEPGSRKSTFAAMLRQQLDAEQSVVVPMDGFHLGNAVIAGTELSARKGAIDTFDVGGFIFGKDRETAEAWAQGSDQINALQIRETKHRAHRIIQWS